MLLAKTNVSGKVSFTIGRGVVGNAGFISNCELFLQYHRMEIRLIKYKKKQRTCMVSVPGTLVFESILRKFP